MQWLRPCDLVWDFQHELYCIRYIVHCVHLQFANTHPILWSWFMPIVGNYVRHISYAWLIHSNTICFYREQLCCLSNSALNESIVAVGVTVYTRFIMYGRSLSVCPSDIGSYGWQNVPWKAVVTQVLERPIGVIESSCFCR